MAERSYARAVMKHHPSPRVRRSPTLNAEERATQIAQIQERIRRLHPGYAYACEEFRPADLLRLTYPRTRAVSH